MRNPKYRIMMVEDTSTRVRDRWFHVRGESPEAAVDKVIERTRPKGACYFEVYSEDYNRIEMESWLAPEEEGLEI